VKGEVNPHEDDPRVVTDAQLVAATASDPAAFRELYERHAGRIYGYHLRRCRDADGAHDLTAETFAQAWLGRLRFRDESDGSAAPWLYGIARNVLAASVRKRSLERGACTRLGILELVDRPAATVEPDPSWLAELVTEELEQLPPPQREAIELHVVDDLSFEEIGRRVGTSTGSARIRAHRGLKTLRQRLHGNQEATS
jgi:RNA polymerase sigma-70 factor (ECF subfamily)